jgi:hypothetical protein
MRRRGAGGRLRPLGALLPAGLCVLLLALSPSAAQPADPEPPSDYCPSREFRIPFGTPDARVSKVVLYVSEDQGRTWTNRATAHPALGHKYFEFKAERDGWFWFAVQTVDGSGQAFPARIDAQTSPNRKVCVDTVRPKVTLQAIPAPSGQAGVSWVIQDENLNNLKANKPGALQLEYRVAGRDLNWTRVSAESRVDGKAFWDVPTSAPLEVRLRAADDAGNLGEGTANVTPGAAGTGGGTDPGPAHATGPRTRQYTNSKRVNLKYNLQDVGKSGVSVVEVWNTTDGRSWQLLNSWKDLPKDLDKPLTIPLTFDKEGLYGFTLIARSGVGRGAAPPQVGDEPQIWIEVDWTRPVVRLASVDVGRGDEEGNLLVSWSAEDKNIDRPDRCVTLSYATDAKGPWTAFAENLPNEGFYRWKMDERTVPFQFYVKVEARDKAGNRGEAKTADLVKVDLKQPKASVIDIEPINPSP